jgi:acetyl-CoA C-acetyltransferase
MQSIIVASHLLGDGMGQVAVAGGMENMSLAPYLLPKARDGYRLGHQQVVDSLITDGLWDPYHNLHMGNCAEQCAEKYHFTREQQDAYASESFRRANAAQRDGLFGAEITPVELPDGKGGAARVEHDEGPARVRYDRIPTLKPSFQRDGTITPANASSINDGAAALVLTSANHAKSRGLKPIARIVSFGAHARDPVWFTTAPAPAVRSALSTAGWSVADVDLWEVSEAFAVVAMTFMHELQVPHGKLNVNGGGIALGHPIGCSGARILVTLLASLQRRGLKRGVAAICIGGGEALATCVELL